MAPINSRNEKFLCATFDPLRDALGCERGSESKIVDGLAAVALEMIGKVTVSVETPAGNVTNGSNAWKIPLSL